MPKGDDYYIIHKGTAWMTLLVAVTVAMFVGFCLGIAVMVLSI